MNNIFHKSSTLTRPVERSYSFTNSTRSLLVFSLINLFINCSTLTLLFRIASLIHSISVLNLKLFLNR